MTDTRTRTHTPDRVLSVNHKVDGIKRLRAKKKKTHSFKEDPDAGNSRVAVSSAAVTIRYDTRCYFNVRSKANMSQLNLPHGADN